METTLVGILSEGNFFKTIESDTLEEAKKKAREFMNQNTRPGTSSKAALWADDGIIAHIYTKIERLSRRISIKRSIPY